MEKINFLVAELDREGTMKCVNSRTSKFIGYTIGETVVNNWLTIMFDYREKNEIINNF